MKKMKKARILAFVLVVSIALLSAAFVSCEKKDEGNVLGSGKTSFTLKITDKEGAVREYKVKTDEKTVGDALIKIGYAPEESKAAGYINKLDGVEGFTDDEGNMWYWSFDVNGEYSEDGVFQVEVKAGDVYGFTYMMFTMEE